MSNDKIKLCVGKKLLYKSVVLRVKLFMTNKIV